MANSLDDNLFWKLRLQSQQAVQQQQMEELDGTAPVKKEQKGQGNKDPLSVDWKGNEGETNAAGGTRPALTLPSTQAESFSMALTKLLALFRHESLETAYNSNKAKLDADSLVNQTKNMASLSLVLNSVTALSSLLNYSAAVSKVSYDAELAMEAAQRKALDEQKAKLEQMQEQLQKLGDCDARLKGAEEAVTTASQAVEAANSAVTMAEDAAKTAQAGVVTAKSAVSDAQAAATAAQSAVTTASQGVAAAEAAVAAAGDDPAAKAEAEANLAKAKEALSQAEADLAAANANVTQAQADLKTAMVNQTAANSQLIQAKNDLKAANNVLSRANAALAGAQKDVQTAAALNAAITELQKTIAEGTYAIDITNVTSKITDLLASSAIYIDKLAEANPNIAIQENFLKNLGIQPVSGKNATEMMTAELTARLKASGISPGEASALAALVMSGDASALKSLPKTTLDVIQKFSNDVSKALQSTLNTVGSALNSALFDAGKLPSNTAEKIKLLYSTMAENLDLTSLQEEEMTTAFLKLMGEVIQEMVELQKKEYEERKAIERQMENHV